MNKHMKTSIALVLTAFAVMASAQEPSQSDLARTFKANDFANELMKGAAPAGKSLTGSLGFINDKKTWYCQINVEGGSKVSAVVNDPTSPERACVQAVLQLSKQKAI